MYVVSGGISIHLLNSSSERRLDKVSIVFVIWLFNNLIHLSFICYFIGSKLSTITHYIFYRAHWLVWKMLRNLQTAMQLLPIPLGAVRQNQVVSLQGKSPISHILVSLERAVLVIIKIVAHLQCCSWESHHHGVLRVLKVPWLLISGVVLYSVTRKKRRHASETTQNMYLQYLLSNCQCCFCVNTGLHVHAI